MSISADGEDGADGDASVGCIIVAAGSGSRLGAGRPKAFVDLGGMTLLEHAVSRVLAGGVGEVVIAVPGSLLASARALVTSFGCLKPSGGNRSASQVVVVAGGADRQASVAAGLQGLSPDVETVLVHDAARCLAPADLVARVLAAVRAGHRAVVPGLAVADTVKRVNDVSQVVGTVDRSVLRFIQTPQGFERALLERAHASAGAPPATDDAALVERLGEVVHVVPGDPLAAKITTSDDLERAQWLLTRLVS